MINQHLLRPVAIAVAPNGGRLTKTDHPALPILPNELARCAAECADAGASLIHVHVRDKGGLHSLDAQAYRQAIEAVRREVADRLVIQITTESLGLYMPEEQMAMVRAVRPEAVSLALREISPNEASEKDFAGFLHWLRSEKISPQFILYSPEEAARLADMHRSGAIPFDDPAVLYVLRRYTTGQTSVPSDLLPFIAPGVLPFLDWTVCAFGRHECACVLAAALMGGNVRVGFENNLLLPSGALAENNAALVDTVADRLSDFGHALASADELRARWG
ncbi:3-keto-5-aminohexanoate cleavage protein [Rhizobium sp. P38BS-XIX]|uniref:3-keto-5-aminohexanoate cleavage protein n=1 Tax=Rhizobium sp. P38BS-XIX TaxID=2726740 RepID=UPI0014579101|nr:3-keto-5-aminohexanoate cleavage protein [Rhizobium sp. P38BS-XIX]NLS01271.1 3-keto-5-aminohexanoate cleavage protein [Rhizobium sp. P38BS-XIX]